MKKIFYAVLWVAVLSTISSASSAQSSFERLLEACQDSTPIAQAICRSKVVGIADTVGMHCYSAKENGASPDPTFTADTLNASIDAILQGLFNWARDNPGAWSNWDSATVATALAEEFPCRY